MSKFEVFLTRPSYPQEGVQLLREKFDVECYPHSETISREALLQGIKGKHALFCVSTDKVDKEVLDAAGPQLKVIATMSVGYEHIEVEECRKRNICVCNGRNPYSPSAVAEVTVALMIITGRKMFEACDYVKRGEWNTVEVPNLRHQGKGLINAVVGIVGMGNIGQAILKRVLSFDVSKVIYFDVNHEIPQAVALGAEYTTFENLLKNSDYVIASCDLNDQSREMFNAGAFSLMKPTAIFVNTSRGGVVQHDDLCEALSKGKIKAAGLDVVHPEPLPKNHKLLSLPNVGPKTQELECYQCSWSTNPEKNLEEIKKTEIKEKESNHEKYASGIPTSKPYIGSKVKRVPNSEDIKQECEKKTCYVSDNACLKWTFHSNHPLNITYKCVASKHTTGCFHQDVEMKPVKRKLKEEWSKFTEADVNPFIASVPLLSL